MVEQAVLPRITERCIVRGRVSLQRVHDLKQFNIDAVECMVNEVIRQVFESGVLKKLGVGHYWYLYEEQSGEGYIDISLQNWPKLKDEELEHE